MPQHIPGQNLVVQGTAVNNEHRVQNVPQVHQDQYVLPGALHANAMDGCPSPTSVLDSTGMNGAGYAQALQLPVNQGYPQDMSIQQDVNQGQVSVAAVAGTNDAGNSNAQALPMERQGSCLSLPLLDMKEPEEELENAHDALDGEFLKIANANEPDEKTTATKPEIAAANAAKPDEEIAAAAKPGEKKKNNKRSGDKKRNAASGSTKKRQKRQKKEKPPPEKITQWTACRKRYTLERKLGEEFDTTLDFVNYMMVDYGGQRRRIHRGVGAGGSARASTEDSDRYQASTPAEMAAYKWLSDFFPEKFEDITDDEWENEEE